MSQITIVLSFTGQEDFPGLFETFLYLPMVSRIIVVAPENPGCCRNSVNGWRRMHLRRALP